MGRAPARQRRPSTIATAHAATIPEVLAFAVGEDLPAQSPFAASRCVFESYAAMLARYADCRDDLRERWPDRVPTYFAERLRDAMIADPSADVERVGLKLAHPPRLPRQKPRR